jgi:nucleoside-diphosphate-sugar epimerase
MKILVTGGAGFIGSHLAEKLCRDGHEVTVLDSLSDFLYPRELKIKNITEFNSLGIKFHHVDMAHDNIDQIVEGHDVVINQAAIPGLVKSWSHLDEYSRSNIVGLGKILEAAKKYQVKRFIQISTSSVYGKTATGSEDSSKNPFSPYGVTKLAAENLARAYESNYELPVVILRYFSVYGPRQRPDMAYNKFISKISQGNTLEVYGDGSQTRTNTYVSDIVNATATCIDLKLLIDGLDFNVSGREKVSLLQVIEILENGIGKKAKLSFEKRREGDQVATEGNFSKANKLLGYSPLVNIERGLLNQIEWQLG